jgi:hypothetical protein
MPINSYQQLDHYLGRKAFMDNEMLHSEYHNILKEIDLMYLDRRSPEGKRPKELSGLFLTSISDEYRNAKNKIMIIGSETAGWNVLKAEEEFIELKDYIKNSMNKHQKRFKKELDGKNSRGYSFYNFARSVAKKCGKNGLIYSNLFCFDWSEGSPIHCKYFETIKKYSGLLIAKQIEVLKPEIVIFANGITSVPYRRELFPIHGDNKVCTNGRDYSDKGVNNHHLWEFDLHNSIRCLRIHHPSARAKSAVKARNYLIENLLPSA